MLVCVSTHTPTCTPACVDVCVHEYVYLPHVCEFLQKPEEGIRCPGAGVTSNCELCDMKVENQIQVFWLSTKPS